MRSPRGNPYDPFISPRRGLQSIDVTSLRNTSYNAFFVYQKDMFFSFFD